MAFQLSPGVNVTEKDLTTIVPAVATTRAGFAGVFNWGPVNKRVLVDSENNLVSLYGTPDDNCAEWWFCAANFLGYGNNLQVVRCKVGDMANANPAGKTAADCYIPNDDYNDSKAAATVGGFVAKYPGSLGNSLEVQVCGSGTLVGLTAPAGATMGGLTAYGTNFNNWTYINQFDANPGSSTVVTDLGGTGDEFHMVVIDRKGLFSGSKGTVLEKFAGLSIVDNLTDSLGNSLNYRDKINANSAYILAPARTGNTYRDIFTGATGAQFHQNGGITAWNTSSFTTVSATGTNTSFGVGVYIMANGNDGFTAGFTPDYKDIVLGQDAAEGEEGYYLFRDSDTVDVNLLIGGPEPVASISTATNTEWVGSSLKDIADARKDCVLFLSCPVKDPLETEQKKLDRCLTYRNSIGSSSYTLIDSGYKYQYDIYNDTYRWIPLNGDIAGIAVRSDVNFDPWWSPAGFNRGQVRGVVKLAYNPRQSARDELYKNNINPVVTFPGEGTVLYGDKTAQTKPSAFDRINVRRLFIVLEKAIATAAKYSLFEFNDAFTRAQFRSLVDPFLRDIQARRGIFEYKVVCDEKNNTPTVIDSNRFVADIYIKPTRSINFIQLNFIATKTGVSFSEVGA
jgi:hypothetical protein